MHFESPIDLTAPPVLLRRFNPDGTAGPIGFRDNLARVLTSWHFPRITRDSVKNSYVLIQGTEPAYIKRTSDWNWSIESEHVYLIADLTVDGPMRYEMPAPDVEDGDGAQAAPHGSRQLPCGA